MNNDRDITGVKIFLIILTGIGILAILFALLMASGMLDGILPEPREEIAAEDEAHWGFEKIPRSGWFYNMTRKTEQEKESSSDRKEEDTGDTQQEDTSGQQQEESFHQDIIVNDKVVFIGDSRTVGMYLAVTGKSVDELGGIGDYKGNVWAAKIGMGYDWMKSTGVPSVDWCITDTTAVVITMGVNDIGGDYGAQDYIDYLNDRAAVWTSRGAIVYYVSVNPVKAPVGTVTNELIDAWNEAMREGLSGDITFIDTNSQLQGQFDFSDSLHYTNETNLRIYEEIRQFLDYS